MNKLKKALVLCSFALLCLAAVRPAAAYFYTYAQTEGVVNVELFDESEIQESITSEGKEVRIGAVPESDPVFIRVKYIAPSDPSIVDIEVVTNENWVEGEADEFGNIFYYYTLPIDGKTDDPDVIKNVTETSLDIKITAKQESEERDPFNVVVLNEMTPALFSETEPDAEYKMYDETKDGWWYADWNYTVEPTTEVGD